MGCSPKYKAPPAPDLNQSYNDQQQMANNWAMPNAQKSYDIYSQFAPQYQAQQIGLQKNQQAEQSSMLDSLRKMTPAEQADANQQARAGQAARGNTGGDANLVDEMQGVSAYSNNRLNQRLGQMGALGGQQGAIGQNTQQSNGLNYFNPNAGSTGQQMALQKYQGQTQNAQNSFQAAQANNPFNMAMSALGSVGSIAGAAMMM